MRLFLSGLRRLARRPATLLTFGLLAGLMSLIILAVAATGGGPGGGNGGGGGGPRFNPLTFVTFPGAYDIVLSFILGLGGLFSLIYGAAIAGSEWSWGTLKAVVARGESRSRYMLTAFGAIAVVVAVGLFVTFLIGVAVAALGATIAKVPLDGIGNADALGRLPEHFARGLVGILAQGALGFAVANLARSQLAGIGAGIGLYFGGTFATIFLPDVVKYLPFQLATAAVGGAGGGFGGGGGESTVTPVPPDVALVLLVVWLVGSLVVAAGIAERADISG
jgi:ABC-type transport system involved in multi-copper enzyme maturation permease subunit